MTNSHECSSADTLSLTFQERFSRRFSSRSTAWRMNSAAGSLSSKTASMRAFVPSGNLAGICSKFICVLPILLISPIDGIVDITYIDDINNGDKPMIAYHAARARLANRNRYEGQIFCKEDADGFLVCGYTIVDHVQGGRVIDRSTGYDGNYASQRALSNALDALKNPEGAAQRYLRSGGHGGSFCTDRGDW